MNHSLIACIGGCCLALLGYCIAAADEVPGALTSAAPALTNVGNRVVLAWSGDSAATSKRVWYATFNGQWSPEIEVPGATTTSAPALGVVGTQLYLATTPPDTDDKIYYYSTEDLVFGPNVPKATPLCDAAGCAHTRASPALLGNESTLYAAWTTPTGAIAYATLSHGSWFIFNSTVPHATTLPTVGPTVAVFGNRLYVAWLDTSGEAISIASATLPLSSSSWSHETTQVKVSSKVAPALGVLAVPSSAVSPVSELQPALFLAWTTPTSTIDFARFEESTGKWALSASPIEMPAGPLTNLSPSLDGVPACTAQHCISTNVLGLAVGVSNSKPHYPSICEKLHCHQLLHGAP